MQNRICILPKDFNPRSCERSDLYNADGTLQIYEISIHAPARGATVAMGMMWIKSKFQSTLLREERLVSAACSNNIFNISIHAPARGATRKGCLQDRLFVFQSTLLREERRKSQSSHFTNELFQSTLLREERQSLADVDRTKQEISIHAPARGATGHAYAFASTAKISIHAPARGATYGHIWRNRL